MRTEEEQVSGRFDVRRTSGWEEEMSGGSPQTVHTGPEAGSSAGSPAGLSPSTQGAMHPGPSQRAQAGPHPGGQGGL